MLSGGLFAAAPVAKAVRLIGHDALPSAKTDLPMRKRQWRTWRVGGFRLPEKRCGLNRAKQMLVWELWFSGCFFGGRETCGQQVAYPTLAPRLIKKFIIHFHFVIWIACFMSSTDAKQIRHGQS